MAVQIREALLNNAEDRRLDFGRQAAQIGIDIHGGRPLSYTTYWAC
jgi:hypothetical protein